MHDWESGICRHCQLHRSVWDEAMGGDKRRPALRPIWRYCHGCAMWQQAENEGPPAGKKAAGWHLEWTPVDYTKGGE